MTISIRSPEAERLAREMAQSSGKSLTDVVVEALRSYRLQQGDQKKRQARLAQRLLAIGLHCANLPTLDERSDEDLIGYDEYGLPS
jgi:antitoxin VapB